MSRPFPPGREQVERLASRLAESLQEIFPTNLRGDMPGNLQENLQSMRGEVEANFRSVLTQGLAKLDLVTREEFEVQEAVLARTREKLEALKARVEALETGAPARDRQDPPGT